MVRPSQLLYPQREPAPLRPPATVLLLRDTPQGIEVLMTRRSATASFAPGAYVFPGGGIDAADAQAQSTRRAMPMAATPAPQTSRRWTARPCLRRSAKRAASGWQVARCLCWRTG